MNGYIDLQSEAEREWEERGYRRRKMLSAIRGCLRVKAWPRWLIVRSLLFSAVPGFVVAWGLNRLGLSWWGPAPAFGVFAMWPFFVFFLRQAAEGLFRDLRPLDHIKTNANHDMTLDIEEFWRQYEPRSEWQETLSENSGEIGRAFGGAGLPFGLVAGLLTLGLWFLWLMVKEGPTLLAEIIFDGCLQESRPDLVQHAAVESWLNNTLAATVTYFVLVAVVVAALAGLLSCIPLTGWGRP